MYYYGYNGGYGNVAPSCSQVPTCCGGSGYGAAIILVLFILLVIVFGAGFNNCSNR